MTMEKAELLKKVGADEKCREVLCRWGKDPDDDRELLSVYTYRIGDVVTRIRELLDATPVAENALVREIEVLKKLLSPRRLEFVDAMFALTTKNQD